MPSVFDLFRLNGKIALVVGGARHLGYDMASALAEAGCAVVVTSRTRESAEAAAARLASDHGVNTLGLALDHRKPDAISATLEKVSAWRGPIDILVNNAGGGSGTKSGAWLDRSPADIASLVETNLLGAMYCCQAAARTMVPRHTGKIINIASVSGLLGRDRRVYERNGMNGQPVDYAAAKAGVIGMTRDLAGLLSPSGICVNAISPGGFERSQMPRGFVADYSDRTPLGRMGRDGIDVKGAVLFLASPASDYVTGHNLVVDGGFSLWR
jgi:NAD(P)-dependent dehydrogenase (short-subunit alcohol dehydrogenase family)